MLSITVRSTPGQATNTPKRYTASIASVNNTRLRSSGSFAGIIEGAGQLTIAQNGSYVLAGAQSMALTGDIVVDDGAVLSLEGDAADLTALQDDPQSIVLNGGVLDLSDFST